MKGYTALHRSPDKCWMDTKYIIIIIFSCQVISQLVVSRGADLDIKNDDNMSVKDILLPTKEEILDEDNKNTQA